MKKALSVLLMGALSFSLLGLFGCGSSSNEETPEPQSAAAEEPKVTEEPEAKPTSGNVVIGQDTSLENPVPFGDIGRMAVYAPADQAYHDVDVQLVEQNSYKDNPDYIKEAVDLHNTFASEITHINLDELNIDGVDVVVLDYTITFPDSFPAPDYGLTFSNGISFNAENIEGGGMPSADGSVVYVGMGISENLYLQDSSTTYKPGDTVNYRCLYLVVEGFDNYVLECMSYPDGSASDSSDYYYAYFAHK